MANKKFSEFTVITDASGLQVVGLKAGDNVRITWANLLSDLPFIPLAGTGVGAPVTGDLEFDANERKLFYNDGAGTFATSPYYGGGGEFDIGANHSYIDANKIISSGVNANVAIIRHTNISPLRNIEFSSDLNAEGFVINAPASDYGLKGAQYFPNKDPNTYAQMADLPAVASDFANDAAAAVGGIAVGAMYHTAGVVKIRLT